MANPNYVLLERITVGAAGAASVSPPDGAEFDSV